MKFGMMNDPAKDIYQEIAYAGHNQFDFIELTIEPPKAQTENIDPSKFLRLCRKYNLDVIGHTNYYLMWASPIRRVRNASIAELKDHIRLFHRLKVEKVNIHSHWFQPNSQEKDIIRRNIESLNELIEYAAKYCMKVMLENTPNGFLNNPRTLKIIFKEVKHLFYHLDVGHAYLALQDNNAVEKFLAAFAERLLHVHFSDVTYEGEKHLPIGKGMVDWKKVIGILKKLGYDDTVTIEVFTGGRQELIASREKIKRLLL